jgi:hypothetical protein
MTSLSRNYHLHIILYPEIDPGKGRIHGTWPVAENPFNLRKCSVRHESAALKGEGKMKGQWFFPKAGNVTEDFQEEAIIYSRENQAGPISGKKRSINFP